MKDISDCKSIIIFNDTSLRSHHGCSRVMEAIKFWLENKKIFILETHFAHKEIQKNQKLLDAINEADGFIINGEGTFHNGAEKAEHILNFCDQLSSKPVFFINGIWENNPQEWLTRLKKFRGVFVRDSKSKETLLSHNIESHFCPDLSLSLAYKLNNQIERQNYIVIGDSVRWETRKLLSNLARFNGAQFVPTKTVHYKLLKKGFLSKALFGFYMSLKPYFFSNYMLPDNVNEYLEVLSKASGHITGRYHGVCLSILTETPFLCLKSKTSKVEQLISDIGINPNRVIGFESIQTISEKDIFPFDNEELEKIRMFNSNALKCADNLFTSIFNAL